VTNSVQIKPSRELLWNDCFKGFQCARLDVPLDWLQPSEDDRAVLAIIKLPAADVETYKSPVFINPGGPGGSGVYALKSSGKSHQRIIRSNHDLISFDPRGVGATTPIVYC
jgi:pimeloyl-ACP methyl ester carboxylesterase